MSIHTARPFALLLSTLASAALAAGDGIAYGVVAHMRSAHTLQIDIKEATERPALSTAR